MVAGTSQNSAGYLRAFLWNGGVLQNLGTLGGSTSSASGVNSEGWVVGTSLTAGNLSSDGFLWMDGSMLDLNNLLPIGSGWTITGAYAINDADDILASAVDNGQNFAVELVPGSFNAEERAEFAVTPEPEALALTAGGLLFIAFIQKRKRQHRRCE
jgi:probable HAF family extracellular repeat protein